MGNNRLTLSHAVAELESELADALARADTAENNVWHGTAEKHADQVADLVRERDTLREQVALLQALVNKTGRANASDELKQQVLTETWRADELRQQLQGAFVPVEIPWADVTPGDMTIARDGTPWMVQEWVSEKGKQVVLRNGAKTFMKTPADDETTRVLRTVDGGA